MEGIKFVRLWKVWSMITEEIVVNSYWQHLSYKHKCVCYCILFRCVLLPCAMHLICLNSLNAHNHVEDSTITIPDLQMRKLEHREFMYLLQNHRKY